MQTIVAFVLAVAFGAPGLAPVAACAADPPVKDISPLLVPVVRNHGVPGMAAAVVHRGDTIALGAASVRTHGKDAEVAAADRFHFGSNTKAMTAFLCDVLVDEGKLRWNQTLGETFPELENSMHPRYRAVTLERLFTHRGGAPGDLSKDALWGELWRHRGTPTAARRRLLQGVTSRPPESPPGAK